MGWLVGGLKVTQQNMHAAKIGLHEGRLGRPEGLWVGGLVGWLVGGLVEGARSTNQQANQQTNDPLKQPTSQQA